MAAGEGQRLDRGPGRRCPHPNRPDHLDTRYRDNRPLSPVEILELYRLRWQIELLFKHLKPLLHLDSLPSRRGPTARSWMLARFLAAALAQKLLDPEGSLPLGIRNQRNPIARGRYPVWPCGRFAVPFWGPDQWKCSDDAMREPASNLPVANRS